MHWGREACGSNARCNGWPIPHSWKYTDEHRPVAGVLSEKSGIPDRDEELTHPQRKNTGEKQLGGG